MIFCIVFGGPYARYTAAAFWGVAWISLRVRFCLYPQGSKLPQNKSHLCTSRPKLGIPRSWRTKPVLKNKTARGAPLASFGRNYCFPTRPTMLMSSCFCAWMVLGVTQKPATERRLHVRVDSFLALSIDICVYIYIYTYGCGSKPWLSQASPPCYKPLSRCRGPSVTNPCRGPLCRVL